MSKSSDTSPAAWNSGISRFYSSLGLLVVLNLIIKPIWIFAIDRKVQLEVGQEEYGSYFALLNLSIILSFMLDLGFTNYFNRQAAFLDDMTQWMQAGRIKYREDITRGLENAPQAFMGLFKGSNFGKLLVQVSE